MSLLSMIEGLTRAGVRFVVIGGVAGAAHGSTRVTNDLDICYEPADENRTRLAELLATWDAYPRGVEPGLPFIMDALTIERAPVLTLTTREGDLDLFDAVAGVGGYREVTAASEDVAVPPLRFRILSLPALLKAKRATGRPKDREALIELETLAALKRAR